MEKITVDVVSDVVCPWCYIGKRRLEKAITSLEDEFEFEINYLPFELNPNMPKEGKNQKTYLTAKFGGESRYKELTENVTKVAAAEGLTFSYENQTKSPNTKDAHRLIWLAKAEGCQPAVKEALLKAYFEDGVDLTMNENLINIVATAGLDKLKAKTLLDSDQGVVEVEYIQQLNHQRGISGVPFYIINNKYGISGAQLPENFVAAFRDIANKVQTTSS